jgi:Ca-activated chloride channel family protein
MAEEFILDWKVDQPAVLAGQAADLFALVTIRPNPARLGALMDLGSDKALPAHLILLVDVSGSMQTLIRNDPEARVVGSGTSEGQSIRYVESRVPTRLMVAQSVVKRLIGRMSPTDRMTLVAFDHQAYPLTAGTVASQPAELSRAAEQLAQIGGGGTSMGQGFQAIINSLGGVPEDGSTRKVVLLTDGEDQEPDFALGQARLLGEQCHVPIYTFGTGDCRGDFLKQIGQTTAGGGFDNITNESEAEQRFEAFFKGQQNILATHVSLALWLSPEIFVQELYRTKPEILYMGSMKPDVNNTLTIPIEYMEKGRAYDFLFSCKVPARESGRRFRLAKVTLSYDIPALTVAGQKADANIAIEYTDDHERAQTRMGDVRRVLAQAEVQRQVLFLQEKIDAIKKGIATSKDAAIVARLLDNLIKKYVEFGDQANANMYRAMQQEFQRQGTISQEMLNRSLAASSKVEGGISGPQDIDF